MVADDPRYPPPRRRPVEKPERWSQEELDEAKREAKRVDAKLNWTGTKEEGMTCQEQNRRRVGWARLLPPNPLRCEFCGYYVIGFLWASLVLLVVIVTCLKERI